MKTKGMISPITAIIQVFLLTLVIFCLLKAAEKIGRLWVVPTITVQEQLTENGFLGEFGFSELHVQHALRSYQSHFGIGLSAGVGGGALGYTAPGKAKYENEVMLVIVLSDKNGERKAIELSSARSVQEMMGIFGIEKVQDTAKPSVRIEYDPAWLTESKKIEVSKSFLSRPKIKRLWLSGTLRFVTNPFGQPRPALPPTSHLPFLPPKTR